MTSIKCTTCPATLVSEEPIDLATRGWTTGSEKGRRVVSCTECGRLRRRRHYRPSWWR